LPGWLSFEKIKIVEFINIHRIKNAFPESMQGIFAVSNDKLRLSPLDVADKKESV